MTFVAGNRCRPILLYVVLIIIGLSLFYVSTHRGRAAVPQSAPLHQH